MLGICFFMLVLKGLTFLLSCIFLDILCSLKCSSIAAKFSGDFLKICSFLNPCTASLSTRTDKFAAVVIGGPTRFTSQTRHTTVLYVHLTLLPPHPPSIRFHEWWDLPESPDFVTFAKKLQSGGYFHRRESIPPQVSDGRWR